MRAFALALTLLAACGAPSIELDVRLDDPMLSDRVARFTLDVYQPEDPPYGCDDLAFDRVAPIPQSRATFDATAPDLGRVRRVGTKLFVVRGLAEGGTAFVAGCAEVGTLEDTTTIVVDLEPVTIPTVEGGSVGLTFDRDRDFERWYVQVQDRLDRPLPSAAVQWEAFGAGMTSPRSGATVEATTIGGRAARYIDLRDPRPGPLEVSVRSRWGAREGVALAFVPPVEREVTLAVGEADPVALDDNVAVAVREGARTSVTVLDANTSTVPGAWFMGRSATSTFLLSDDTRRAVNDDGSLGAPQPFAGRGAPRWIVDLATCGADDAQFAVGFADETVAYGEDARTIESIGDAPRSGCVADQRVVYAPDRAALWWVESGGLTALPFDPRIVDVGFGGLSTDAPDVALTTVVEGREVGLSVRPRVTRPDGLLTEPPRPVLGTPEAVEYADLDGNGTWETIAISRVARDRHALVVTVAAGARSVVAGLVLERTYERPWVAAVQRGATTELVVVDRARGGAATVFTMP